MALRNYIMVKLGKPTEYHNIKVKTANGTASIEEDRYIFGTAVKKDGLDKTVLKDLKQRLKEDGPMYMSVSYWTDQIYSTGFQLIEDASQLNMDMFDSDMFSDYNESEIMDPNTKIGGVSIYTAPAGGHSSKGKDGEHNDCFYECVVQAFNELPKILSNPARFKKWLGLDRNDGVDIELMPKVEKKLKINLYISGSHQYESEGKYPRTLKMRLWKGHYEGVRTLDQYIDLKRGYDEREGRPYPIMFKKNLENQTVKIAYYAHYAKDSKNKIVEEKPIKYLDEFYDKENPHRFHFLRAVPREKKMENGKVVKVNGKTVYHQPEPEDVLDDKIEEYVQFQRCSYQMLGKHAVKTLNPFHAKGNYRALSSHFFYKTAPKAISFCDEYMYSDEPLRNEEHWLKSAMTGGLIYSMKKKLKKAYEADINSMYPWLMLNCDFITRKGKFKVLKEVPDYEDKYQYAIFRCDISGYDNRLFQKNRHGFYTGLDIKTAQDEGWDIELKDDGYPNMLWYTKFCRVPGKEVFGVFVNDMYALKENHVEGAKKVMNCLWGYLCARSVMEVKTWKDPVVEDMSLLHKIAPRFKTGDKQEYAIKKYNIHDMQDDSAVRKKIFRFKYARFACFMTALGRHEMFKVLKPIKKYVYRIHTDGFITSKDVADVTVGTALGEWKTKEGSCEVVNANVVHWD